MASFSDGMTFAQWNALKRAVIEVAAEGPFDVHRATRRVLARDVSRYVGDVAAILEDLVELGYLRPLVGDPPRWELASPTEQSVRRPRPGSLR